MKLLFQLPIGFHIHGVLLTGATPVVIECSEEQGFKLTAKDLEAAITNNTKWVILNSPSNPTGLLFKARN